MLGPFATVSRHHIAIHQVSPLYCRTPPARRQRRQRHRQRVTEGTVMARWNGPKSALKSPAPGASPKPCWVVYSVTHSPHTAGYRSTPVYYVVSMCHKRKQHTMTKNVSVVARQRSRAGPRPTSRFSVMAACFASATKSVSHTCSAAVARARTQTGMANIAPVLLACRPCALHAGWLACAYSTVETLVTGYR